MGILYVPYLNSEPVTVNVKGHNLLLVSPDSEEWSAEAEKFGADEIREIEVPVDFAKSPAAGLPIGDELSTVNSPSQVAAGDISTEDISDDSAWDDTLDEGDWEIEEEIQKEAVSDMGKIIAAFGDSFEGGLVVAPEGVSPTEMLKTLESQLSWVQ